MRKARGGRLSSIASVSFSTRGRKSQDTTKLKAIHNAELPSPSGLFFLSTIVEICLKSSAKIGIILNLARI